jgi:hypothetical protein
MIGSGGFDVFRGAAISTERLMGSQCKTNGGPS